jgi:hypothetical protein
VSQPVVAPITNRYALEDKGKSFIEAVMKQGRLMKTRITFGLWAGRYQSARIEEVCINNDAPMPVALSTAPTNLVRSPADMLGFAKDERANRSV